MMNLSLLGFVMPGTTELMIILVIFLVLFGGARLPSLMRNLGRSATEFRKGMKEDVDAVEESPSSDEDDA